MFHSGSAGDEGGPDGGSQMRIGVRCQVSGVRFQVPGVRRHASDVRRLLGMCGAIFLLKPGTWNLTPETWNLEPGPWNLTPGGIYADNMARPAVRRANVIEEPRLHRSRRPDAGARDRREHGDLFSHRSDSASAFARGKAGGVGRVAVARAEDGEGMERWGQRRPVLLSDVQGSARSRQRSLFGLAGAVRDPA